MEIFWNVLPVLVIVAVLGLLALDRRPWLRERTLKTVTVHTAQGQSFEGLLAVVAPDGIVLRQARFLDGQGEVPLSGETFLPKAQVSFVQVGA